MTSEEVKELYKTNADFKAYCDKELSLRRYDDPLITLDVILDFVIIKAVAEYYKEKESHEQTN